MADETRIDLPGPRRKPAPATRLDRPAAAPATAPATRLDPPTRPPGSTPPAAAAGGEYHRDNLPPSLAARFTIRRELGGGAEASVVSVVDARGHEYAVKLFRQEPMYRNDFGSPQYRAHFRRECAVEVFERGVDHGVHFELMEYCRFGTLDDYLSARGGFGTHEHAVEILRKLAAALAGIQRPPGSTTTLVHGDIKPSNILVRHDTPLELVLADFGLAADLGDRSKLTNTGQGSIAWAAPGALHYKATSVDWWSVGMVAFRVLSGRSYFQYDDGRWMTEQAIQHHLETREIALDGIDGVALAPALRSRWKLLLAGLLTRDSDSRWGAEQVQQWCAGGTPAAPAAAPRPDAPGAGSSSGARRTSVPFALPGVGEYHDPAALGRAMAENPGAAARALSGRGSKALRNWLTDEAKVANTFTDLKSYGGGWTPDELATYYVAQLVPDAALVYRGRRVGSPSELFTLAQDSSAAADIAELYRHQLLGCLVAEGPRRGYKMIDTNWRDMVEQAEEIARTQGLHLEADELDTVKRNGLMVAAGGEDAAAGYLDSVRRRLSSSQLRYAGETAWFAELRRGAGL